jgi:hypothetical protein
MINNNVEAKNLGSGVVLFENAFNLDWNYLIDIVKKETEKEWSEMYKEAIDPNTGDRCYINRSGYFFSKEGIELMPRRAGSVHQTNDKAFKDILNFIEKTKDEYLLKYFELFPLAYKCVWWKVKGHFLEYKNGVYLGKHSDNSVDYYYGIQHPPMQLAIRGVVTALVYLNSSSENESEDLNSFVGGEHYFNYLNIKYKPKKGDILMFPSNYMAAHEVMPVTSGFRYSYLGWYSQGTPNELVNENVADPISDPETADKATNVYMPSLREDFANHLKQRGYDLSSDQYSVLN